MITSGGKTIVVDMGTDFRIQMQREGIKKIDYVLITHSHMDHTASLAELRAGGGVHLEAPADVFDSIRKKRSVLTYLKTRNPKIIIENFRPHKIGNIFVDSIRVMEVFKAPKLFWRNALLVGNIHFCYSISLWMDLDYRSRPSFHHFYLVVCQRYSSTRKKI